MKRAAVLIAVVLPFVVAPDASAQLEFRLFKTDDMLVVYMDKDHEYILPHLTNCFTNSFDFHKQLFDYTPSERVTVLLQDFDDYGYAGASAMPTNYLTIGIEPFEYVYETSPTNERINWVMSHELLHIVASDKPAPTDERWRKIFFGKVAPIPEQPLSMVYSYLTTPRMYAPRWYHEGMAVFFETWMAGGYGRALGGYDEMVFRTMIQDDAYFYDTVGLESEGKAIDTVPSHWSSGSTGGPAPRPRTGPSSSRSTAPTSTASGSDGSSGSTSGSAPTWTPSASIR